MNYFIRTFAYILFLVVVISLSFRENIAVSKNTSECKCDVTGFLVDPDKSGTNVRRSPGGKSFKKLPLQTDPKFESGVYIRIKASRNGWLQIAKVIDTAESEYSNSWVFGKLVGSGTRNYDNLPVNLYSKPSKRSAVTGKLHGQQTVSILGCCGKWIYAAGVDKNGKRIEGWLEPAMLCPSAVTNCN